MMVYHDYFKNDLNGKYHTSLWGVPNLLSIMRLVSNTFAPGLCLYCSDTVLHQDFNSVKVQVAHCALEMIAI